MALVAGEGARTSGWAAQAAASLARQWRGPRRVVLADLDFERPAIHDVLGVPDDEGLVDVLEFGTSFSRVSRGVAGATFDAVPAGVFGGDPSTLLRSPAWGRILLEVASRQGTLLALVPALQEGMTDVVDRAGAVIVLATPEEATATVERLPHPFAVLVVLTPAGAESVGGQPDGGEPVVTAAGVEAARLSDDDFERIRIPTERAAREALIADMRSRQRAARLVAPPEPAFEAAGVAEQGAAAGASGPVIVPTSGGEAAREMRTEAAADEVELDAIDPSLVAVPEPKRGGWRGPVAWTLLVVLMLSLLAGAWRYLGGRIAWPVRTAAPAATTPVPPVALPPAEPAAPAPGEEALPFSVAIEAHQSLHTAFDRVDALRGSEADIAFHIVPLEREGAMYYYVMAGPVADSASATALRDTLLARRVKTTATPTDIRHAPLALLVGDYGARDAAERLIDELRGLDIPAYMIVGTAADAEPVYRVFVGGFAGPAEADSTRQLLRAAGVSDRLVTRTRSSIS